MKYFFYFSQQNVLAFQLNKQERQDWFSTGFTIYDNPAKSSVIQVLVLPVLSRALVLQNLFLHPTYTSAVYITTFSSIAPIVLLRLLLVDLLFLVFLLCSPTKASLDISPRLFPAFSVVQVWFLRYLAMLCCIIFVDGARFLILILIAWMLG